MRRLAICVCVCVCVYVRLCVYVCVYMCVYVLQLHCDPPHRSGGVRDAAPVGPLWHRGQGQVNQVCSKSNMYPTHPPPTPVGTHWQRQQGKVNEL